MSYAPVLGLKKPVHASGSTGTDFSGREGGVDITRIKPNW